MGLVRFALRFPHTFYSQRAASPATSRFGANQTVGLTALREKAKYSMTSNASYSVTLSTTANNMSAS